MMPWRLRALSWHSLDVLRWLDAHYSHDDLVAVLERRIRERGHVAITVFA
jgi:hypothetical protein